jgi:hypothetical protein
MKNLSAVLATVLLSATMAPAEEQVQVRYQEPSGRFSVSMSQNIKAGKALTPVASREFSFDLMLVTEPVRSDITVTIDRAKASYEAHGMKTRLGTRHLTGKSFPLSIGAGGRQLEQSEPSAVPLIGLGQVPSDGFSIAGMLTDILPVLPEKTIAVGTTWITERPVLTLEGWGWAAGQLTSRHQVTAVEKRDDHTIVTVTTEAKASLGPTDEKQTYSGALKRTLKWTFDATIGSLISMTMEQTADSVSSLPQGEVPVLQVTHVEMAPAT